MTKEQIIKAEWHVREFLKLIGQDVNKEELKETPKRFVKFYNQFLSENDWAFKTFKNESDEMIIVKNIPFFSMCEHHLAPFFGKAAIAYIPNDKMAGLSKLPRTIDKFSRRLQNQERITKQVSEYMMEKLEPKGVGVFLEARHMCVEMRGVQKCGSLTTTSSLLGIFKEHQVRTEFFNLIKNK